MSENDDTQAELVRLKAENEKLKAQQSRGISLKVSEFQQLAHEQINAED